MPDSPMLQIAVVLLFTFLVMAAIVSLVQQLIVQGFRMRARNLRHSIKRLLSDEEYDDEIYKRFYQHPLTASLTGGQSEATRIEPMTFVTALANAVRPRWSDGDPIAALPASVAALRDGKLKERLQLVMPPAGSPRQDIIDATCAWFTTTEQKMRERFKADSVALSYGVAVVMTVFLNVSTLEIVQRLRADDQMRMSFALLAPELAPVVFNNSQAAMSTLAATGENADATTGPNAAQFGTILTVFECAKGQTALPVGWDWMVKMVENVRSKAVQSRSEAACAAAVTNATGNPEVRQRLAQLRQRAPGATVTALTARASTPQYGPTFGRNGVAEVLLGWLITIAAAAQGAPFWFNAIRRIVGR